MGNDPTMEPIRCAWPGLSDRIYQDYHDREWGVPVRDDRKLFEKLCLEGFQAGLSWLTILKKREGFRRAFEGFDPEVIARYGEKDISRLMSDDGIVRSRAKIEAAIGNARAYLLLKEEVLLTEFVWGFAPKLFGLGMFERHGDIPATTPESTALAKALKAKGFRFVGPTTAYAFMQSVGMVNDHLACCHRYRPCADLQRAAARERGVGGGI